MFPSPKNYLDAKQIRQLERAVSSYFDYIEDLIERENAFTMEQFASSVNEFLAFRRYDVLPDKGRISAAAAKKKAEAEYDAFNKTQCIVSDFDREVQRLIESESANKHVYWFAPNVLPSLAKRSNPSISMGLKEKAHLLWCAIF